MCPRSGLSDVNELRAGIGVLEGEFLGGVGSMREASKTLPSMNGTRKVSASL